MTHQWDSGFMVHKPSWHRLEKAVLKESPQSWEEARQQAGLMWEIETAPVFDVQYEHLDLPPEPRIEVIEGFQQIRRDDTHSVLTIRPSSYEAIRNEDFGGVINALLGLEDDEHVEFEALMALYGGKQIIALVNFPEPLKMPWDPSKTYLYLCFASRHDGNGGLRGLATNVRVQCANTMNLAEALDGRLTGFTIRHTSNWEERVSEIRQELIAARGDNQKWLDFTEQLAMWKVGGRQREAYLKKFLPVSDDNGKRKNENQLLNRERIRTILSSKTCEGIEDNGYGLLMATTEWSDHVRETQTTDSYVARQLLRKEEPKAKSARILRQMAGVKL
jgi:phage/plasmid-like protein (TIGR03299 family)